MNILLDNVNLSSTSGPNHFGRKLKSRLDAMGHTCSPDVPRPDAQLSFIETHMSEPLAPMIVRLDGVYFDTESDFVSQNKNILRSYKLSSGAIFQSEYCRELIFKFFGEHENSQIIHNGADLQFIKSVQPMENELTAKFENVWTCASSWYYNNNPNTPRRWKRLKENVEFFQQYAAPRDCLVVAGDVALPDRVQDSRVFYSGRLPTDDLFSLYKASKYFIHLASPDACPNVVVDARASGCRVICSSLGGAKEIAGPDAMIVKEEDWDYEPMQLNGTRPMDLTTIGTNCYNAEMDMGVVSARYANFLKQVVDVST
jgi:glycosyltransferase involved in cell wall biosynthesis